MIALLGLYFYKLQAIDVRKLKNNAHESGIQRKKEKTYKSRRSTLFFRPLLHDLKVRRVFLWGHQIMILFCDK